MNMCRYICNQAHRLICMHTNMTITPPLAQRYIQTRTHNLLNTCGLIVHYDNHLSCHGKVFRGHSLTQKQKAWPNTTMNIIKQREHPSASVCPCFRWGETKTPLLQRWATQVRRAITGTCFCTGHSPSAVQMKIKVHTS